MRSVIHALKYNRVHPAARRMGSMLAQAIATLAAEAPTEMLVVPIPLHRTRQAERGFNQARLLAAHAIKALRTSHPEWRLTLAPAALMRLRATESQASLTPRERRNNVRGAFSVSDAAMVSGRHILLVDDILTTGATARAAAQVLKRAGAATVWVATLARARRVDHGVGRLEPQTLDAQEENSGKSETQGEAGQEQHQERVDSSMIQRSWNQPSF